MIILRISALLAAGGLGYATRAALGAFSAARTVIDGTRAELAARDRQLEKWRATAGLSDRITAAARRPVPGATDAQRAEFLTLVDPGGEGGQW